jgi:hypothetical protein
VKISSNLWRYWLPIVALSLFLSRCLYEANPIQFVSIGDWLAVLIEAAAALLIAYVIKHLIDRRQPDWTPPDLSACLLLFVYVVWPQVDPVLALIVFLGALALLGANTVLPDHPRWFEITLVVIVFALYFATLSQHVGAADTFEFQVVMPQWGIAHPTGYPLFVTLGKLFSLLPLGSMALRLNVLSALIGTLAVWVIYRLIVRLTQPPPPALFLENEEADFRRGGENNRLPAAIAALLLAASTIFWSQAIVIEVYGLNALLVAVVLWLLVRLLQNPESRIQKWLIYAVALTLGLGLSHHLDSVILFMPAALTLFFMRPKLLWRSWLIAAGCFLLGLTPWLLIFFRWPALHNGQWLTIGEWIGWVTGQRFGGALNLALWSDPTRWGIMLRLTLEQFGWAGTALAVIGLIALVVRARRAAAITVVTFAGYFFFGLVYNVPDVSVFVIPLFLCLAIWIGVALSAIVQGVSDRLSGTSRFTPEGVRGAVILLFSILPILSITNNYAVNNQREAGVVQEAWGRYVLSLPIAEKAALLVDSEKIAPLYYLQVTENVRPDLDIMVLGDEALYRQELDRRINAGQAVYLARFLPNLPYRMRSLGPMVEISREPSDAVPTIGTPINASFGDQIELLGVTEEQSNPYRVNLVWKATSPERKNYHVRLRLVDAQDEVWWEDTGAHPVNGYYPTGAWALGEVVTDFHEVKLEPYLRPGTYDLQVGLFTPFRNEGLKTSGKDYLNVAQISIIAPKAQPLARQVRMVYERTALTSLDEPGTVPPESPVTLRVDAIGADAPAIFALINERSVRSTFTQTVRAGQTRLAFAAPEFEGQYRLYMTTGRAARCHWFSDLTTECQLGTLTVTGDAIEDTINFENQVLLAEARLDRDTLQPNEAIKVDLTWQGLKTWPDNYTAFVHLVGPDGKVHGQVDQWPVQGTLPTSSWTAGQVVADPYTIALPADAPRGKYQVEVGWYLLSTLRRLNVLDAAGRPSDDHVIVGEFMVP